MKKIELPTREQVEAKYPQELNAIELLVNCTKMGVAIQQYVTDALQEAYNQGFVDGKKWEVEKMKSIKDIEGLI